MIVVRLFPSPQEDADSSPWKRRAFVFLLNHSEVYGVVRNKVGVARRTRTTSACSVCIKRDGLGKSLLEGQWSEPPGSNESIKEVWRGKFSLTIQKVE